MYKVETSYDTDICQVNMHSRPQHTITCMFDNAVFTCYMTSYHATLSVLILLPKLSVTYTVY